MKKSILTTLILIAVLLLASCDYNDLGNMRRFNMGYAGDYAVAQAQEATKNLVTLFNGFQMPDTTNYKTTEGKAKIESLRIKLSAVDRTVEDIKNSKDVESEMKKLLNTRVANIGVVTSNETNHFNLKKYIEAATGNSPDEFAKLVFKFMLHVDVPDGDDPFIAVQQKTGIYPDISLAVPFNGLVSLALIGTDAYKYKYPEDAEKTRVQELIDNLSGGEQAGNENLKKALRNAAEIISNNIIKPMAQRYRDGYLIYADYIFTALFADIDYTFYDLITDHSVPMNENIFKTDGVSRIVSYIGTIEYIYDVDFGIIDILNTMIDD